MLILSAFIHFVAAGLLMMLVNWAGAIRWRRATATHWTERARLLWPVRVSGTLCVFLVPVLLFFIHATWFPQGVAHWELDGGAALLGVLLGGYPLQREMFPGLSFKLWLHQLVVAVGLRLALILVFLGGVVAMPETIGWRSLVVATVALALQLAVLWGFVLHFLRWVKYVHPAGERLRQIVADAAAAPGSAPRAVWQMAGPQAYAFAFPTTREIVFSDRLVEICTAAELASVASHELAHLSESKWVLAGRLFGSLSFFPLVFSAPAFHYFEWAGFIGLLLAGLAMVMFARFLSQRMERRADHLAAGQQVQEGAYARALEHIYRENHIPAVNTSNRQTHPHLYDRMVAAGVTPDYPRPAKPARLALPVWLLLVALGGLVALNVWRNESRSASPRDDSEPPPVQVAEMP